MLIYVFDCLERQVRIAGVALELLGVLTVALGIRDTRRAFDDSPTMWQAIKQRWDGRPRFGPKNVVLAAEGASFGTSFGSARLTVRAGPNATIEQRIDLLEQNYDRLTDELDRSNAEAKKKWDELSKALDLERKERQMANEETRRQLTKSIAEGVHLEFIGVVLFAVGMIAATASQEIVKMFGEGQCS
jgi:hypothetical protein